MRNTQGFPITAGCVLAASVMFIAITMTAQTVISNETLVTTTFVVNKTGATAKCGKRGCTAKTPMLKSILVTCPAAIGQTCTFHIALDAQVSLTFPPCPSILSSREEEAPQIPCTGPSPTTSYQFLVDGLAPTVGPTDGQGDYLFARNVQTESDNIPFFIRQSFAASVITTVANTNSNNHTIDVNIRCSDTAEEFGCEAIAHSSTMRVDVFEP